MCSHCHVIITIIFAIIVVVWWHDVNAQNVIFYVWNIHTKLLPWHSSDVNYSLVHSFKSSALDRLDNVFLMRRAVSRAAPLLYQHSFINLAITRRACKQQNYMNTLLLCTFVKITIAGNTHSSLPSCNSNHWSSTLMAVTKCGLHTEHLPGQWSWAHHLTVIMYT